MPSRGPFMATLNMGAMCCLHAGMCGVRAQSLLAPIAVRSGACCALSRRRRCTQTGVGVWIALPRNCVVEARFQAKRVGLTACEIACK